MTLTQDILCVIVYPLLCVIRAFREREIWHLDACCIVLLPLLLLRRVCCICIIPCCNRIYLLSQKLARAWLLLGFVGHCSARLYLKYHILLFKYLHAWALSVAAARLVHTRASPTVWALVVRENGRIRPVCLSLNIVIDKDGFRHVL